MVNKTSRQYSVGAATFAERLNRLFAAVWPPGRGPYRSFEVTGALARRGYQLSAITCRNSVRAPGSTHPRARRRCWPTSSA